ncbi:MAG: hypothetical protein AAGK23_11050, partial [Pseudomonadota bacterium]
MKMTATKTAIALGAIIGIVFVLTTGEPSAAAPNNTANANTPASIATATALDRSTFESLLRARDRDQIAARFDEINASWSPAYKI